MSARSSFFRYFCAFVSGLVSVAVFLSPCYAELRFGRMTLSPFLSLSEAYRTNIYQTETDRKSDFVTVTDLGFRLRYQFGTENTFDAGYKLGFFNYARYSRNDYTDQRADGTINVRFPGGLNFRLSHNFIDSTYERSALTARMRDYR